MRSPPDLLPKVNSTLSLNYNSFSQESNNAEVTPTCDPRKLTSFRKIGASIVLPVAIPDVDILVKSVSAIYIFFKYL